MVTILCQEIQLKQTLEKVCMCVCVCVLFDNVVNAKIVQRR